MSKKVFLEKDRLTIRIKEHQYKPARKRRGTVGKPELNFLDEIGKFTV
jgi:hypothetical protein